MSSVAKIPKGNFGPEMIFTKQKVSKILTFFVLMACAYVGPSLAKVDPGPQPSFCVYEKYAEINLVTHFIILEPIQ